MANQVEPQINVAARYSKALIIGFVRYFSAPISFPDDFDGVGHFKGKRLVELQTTAQAIGNEPVRGQAVYFRVEDEYLAARRRRRGAHAMLRAGRDGEVRLLPLDGVRLTKNNVPVRQEGSLVGPRDVIRLGGLEIRFENYRQT